jgi:hypothetical protein
MTMTAIEGWREYIQTHDAVALRRWLHPDMVFESPILGTPQVGVEASFRYLEAAGRILGGPNARVVAEWRNETGSVLELTNEIEGIRVNLVDIITLTPDKAQITHFKVMVRPLKAINLVMRLMTEELARA